MGPALAQAWIHPSETDPTPDIHGTAPSLVPATASTPVSANYRGHSYIPPSLIASARSSNPAPMCGPPPALPPHTNSCIDTLPSRRQPPPQPKPYDASQPTQQSAPQSPPSYDPSQPDILPPPVPYMPGSGGTPYQRTGYGNAQSLNDGFGAGRKGDIYGGGMSQESKDKKERRESSYKWMKKGVKGLGDLLG